MATPEQSRLLSWGDVELLPDLRRLEFVLDHLPDEGILAALGRRRGRGRNDFPVRAMWRALVAGVVLRHPTAAALLRELGRNAQLPALCGFEALPGQTAAVARVKRDRRTGRLVRDPVAHPQRPSAPAEWAFSRFMANVVALERRDGLASALAPKLRRELPKAPPDCGECLGADGKAIRSHSTGRTLKGGRRASDPDADRGAHAHRGVDRRTGKPWERVASWFGRKPHLAADAKHELPVAFSVERASASERKAPPGDLAALFAEEPVPADRRRFPSADRGCDQEKLKAWLWEARRIRPLLDTRETWRGDWDAPPAQPGLPKLRPVHPGRVDNVPHSGKGRVFCRCPATGGMRPMAFQGRDGRRAALKRLCPAVACGPQCAGRAQCRRDAGIPESGCGRSLRIHLRKANRRILPPTPHGATAWRREYARRSALERMNSRLDNDFGFEGRIIRGKDRMTARVGLALAVMTALALGGVRARAHDRMRSLIRPPPAQAAWHPFGTDPRSNAPGRRSPGRRETPPKHAHAPPRTEKHTRNHPNQAPPRRSEDASGCRRRKACGKKRLEKATAQVPRTGPGLCFCPPSCI